MAEVRSVTRRMEKAAPRDRGCEASRDRVPRHHGRGANRAPGSAGEDGEIQTGRPPAGGRAGLLRWDHDGTPHARAHARERGEGAYRLTGAFSCGCAMKP